MNIEADLIPECITELVTEAIPGNCAGVQAVEACSTAQTVIEVGNCD